MIAFDILQVNVASYCALTPQYKDLVQLYEQFHADGLEVMLC
jgi:glutathione peroxidase-family protein